MIIKNAIMIIIIPFEIEIILQFLHKEQGRQLERVNRKKGAKKGRKLNSIQMYYVLHIRIQDSS